VTHADSFDTVAATANLTSGFAQQRTWLKEAIIATHPAHPWIERL
jgi:hypothetical protein